MFRFHWWTSPTTGSVAVAVMLDWISRFCAWSALAMRSRICEGRLSSSMRKVAGGLAARMGRELFNMFTL